MEREEKKALLLQKAQKAIELEWATIPTYLSAWFSLKPSFNRECSAILKSIFMEEMLHMVLAANLLSSIGGSPKCTGNLTPSYPLTLEFRGDGFRNRRFPIHLEPFSAVAIDTFIQIEAPEPVLGLQIAELIIEGITIGEFYRGIVDDLESLCQ